MTNDYYKEEIIYKRDANDIFSKNTCVVNTQNELLKISLYNSFKSDKNLIFEYDSNNVSLPLSFMIFSRRYHHDGGISTSNFLKTDIDDYVFEFISKSIDEIAIITEYNKIIILTITIIPGSTEYKKNVN